MHAHGGATACATPSRPLSRRCRRPPPASGWGEFRARQRCRLGRAAVHSWCWAVGAASTRCTASGQRLKHRPPTPGVSPVRSRRQHLDCHIQPVTAVSHPSVTACHKRL